jgi:cysteine-rich repeat protein
MIYRILTHISHTSASCVVEDGYACTAGGANGVSGADVCNNGCNNGTLETGEGCDDGNIDVNDGCDTKCRIETGWACTTHDVSQSAGIAGAVRSVCNAVSGDGFRVTVQEDCDDGNIVSGDGCSHLMRVEAGATCTEDSTLKSSCQTCGNGKVEGFEVCDFCS